MVGQLVRTLCGLEFRKGKRSLLIAPIGGRSHVDVERCPVPRQLWSNHAADSLEHRGQVASRHLFQVDSDPRIKQFAFVFLSLLCTMGREAAAEHPRQIHERSAFANRTLFALAAADHFAIKTKNCI